MKINSWPKISIVTPVLNAATVLEPYFESIKMQDYPKDMIEIILPDGGSKDETLNLAKKYGAIVYANPLKTAEAGKAVGVKKATGQYVVLIDSDNILPDKNWLKQMIEPLEEHSEAVGSEPWQYTWRKEDGFIARYCALIGMNDPLVHFFGNYDRVNLLTGKWTEVPHKELDSGDYLVATFTTGNLPTMGANGTVFRTKFLQENVLGDYLFDIDILAAFIKKTGSVTFIKTKNGIIHTFCESDIAKFARKQKRRVKDYLYHQYESNDRDYAWEFKDSKKAGLTKFVIYCLLVFPLIFQSIKGYFIKPDLAWFFHPLACEITLWEYGWGVIGGLFKKEEVSREGWKQ